MNDRYSADQDYKQLRVLVTDDSGIVKSQLVRCLQGLGCVVVGLASSGAEAVEMYKKLMPDFVTMDIEMPGMNGIEALKGIMAHDRGAVVIMVTTVSNKASVVESIKHGARNYILKPIVPDTVRVALEKCFPDVAFK